MTKKMVSESKPQKQSRQYQRSILWGISTTSKNLTTRPVSTADALGHQHHQLKLDNRVVPTVEALGHQHHQRNPDNRVGSNEGGCGEPRLAVVGCGEAEAVHNQPQVIHNLNRIQSSSIVAQDRIICNHILR